MLPYDSSIVSVNGGQGYLLRVRGGRGEVENQRKDPDQYDHSGEQKCKIIRKL